MVESRSKTCGGPPLVPAGSPESPEAWSSSHENLELTVLLGDRLAGDVGASHPGVRDSATLPGTASPTQ